MVEKEKGKYCTRRGDIQRGGSVGVSFRISLRITKGKDKKDIPVFLPIQKIPLNKIKPAFQNEVLFGSCGTFENNLVI